MNLIYLPIIEQIDDTVFVLQTDFCMDATSKRSNKYCEKCYGYIHQKKVPPEQQNYPQNSNNQTFLQYQNM